jgi:hypothetical protein
MQAESLEAVPTWDARTSAAPPSLGQAAALPCYAHKRQDSKHLGAEALDALIDGCRARDRSNAELFLR